MWIDLDNEDSQETIHNAFDLEGNPTGKERTTIPTFDLYSSEVGDDNSKDRVTTFIYEIRCAPKSAYILKYLIYKVSSQDPNFNFIPHGLNSITTQITSRQIFLRMKTFLEEMAIVPINKIFLNSPSTLHRSNLQENRSTYDGS